MEEIKRLIYSNAELTNDQIMGIFHEIGSRGDIILIKNDGLRQESRFTVVIGSGAGSFDSIRCDAENVSVALANCLRRYFDTIRG